MTKYTYILSDFLNNIVDIEKLEYEIQQSSISTKYNYINYSNNVEIYFLSDLTSSEQITLDDIINNHNGQPLNSYTGSGHSGEMDERAYFPFVQDISLSSTTAQNPITKLHFATKKLNSGTYKIIVSFEWRATGGHPKFGGSIGKSDVIINGENLGEVGIDREVFRADCRVFYKDLSSSNTIELRFWNDNGDTTEMKNASIEIIKL